MPITIALGNRVDFADTSSRLVESWFWAFGDGTTSILQNPSHTYAATGTYTVVLEATGPGGTARIEDTVTVTESTSVAYTAPSPPYGESRGADPMVMLRLSNDAGKTWICELQRPAGKQGEYWRRVRWNRLGMARRRVFEVVVTDPVPWKLTGAYVEMASEQVA